MADDKKRKSDPKEKADQIITDMAEKNASAKDIQEQKEKNKKYLGHEGTVDLEHH